jgi:hypothetical protein
VACRFDTYYLTAYCRLRSPRRGLPRRETDPARLLPLTPLAFSILLALADQDLHGYAIAQRIASATPAASPCREILVRKNAHWSGRCLEPARAPRRPAHGEPKETDAS